MNTNNQNKNYHIITWGCQMNEEDSEQMALYLEQAGYSHTDSLETADLVLLNTCSVRKKPEDKAFSQLGILELLKAEKPHLIVGVAGCMAQVRAKEILRRARSVDFVVGTAQLAKIPEIINTVKTERKRVISLDMPIKKSDPNFSPPDRIIQRAGGLKAHVPIQYGCDRFCAFCIVPATRGRERSRNIADIIEEIKALVDLGVVEVTLLGQTVNSYGKNLDNPTTFANLLNKVSELEGLKRIRYTSPYPTDFTDELIDTIAQNPKVMEHVHLPMQSGDNEVLSQMRRRYTIDEYYEVAAKLRDKVKNIAITTDIIVGFPGETEQQFQNTLEVVRNIRFDSAFMFAYSPRPNTPAEDRTDQVSKDDKRRRLLELIQLQNSITDEINQKQAGITIEMLVEGRSVKNPAKVTGFSREFKTIMVKSPDNLIGQILRVETTQAHIWGFDGKIIE